MHGRAPVWRRRRLPYPMKTRSSARLRASLFALGFVCCAGALPAAVIFNYGPSDAYVSGGNRGFNRPAAQLSSSPYVYATSFSDASALRVVNSDYSGPTLYGGYRFSSSTLATGVTTQAIRDNRSFGGLTYDTIGLQSTRTGGWSGSDLSLHGLFVFKQESFLGGASSGAVAVDGISMRLSGSGNASGDPFALTGRYVVQAGGSYYVSETTINLVSNNQTVSLSGSALAAERWAAYAPATTLNFDQASASFSALALQSVTAVGVYFENDGWAGTNAANAAYTFEVLEFSVTGSAIPEPSSAAALAGLVVLGAGLSRRSRRRAAL